MSDLTTQITQLQQALRSSNPEGVTRLLAEIAERNPGVSATIQHQLLDPGFYTAVAEGRVDLAVEVLATR